MRREKGNFLTNWVLPFVMAFVVAMAINKFLIFNIYVPSGSMIPAININDRIIVSRVYNTEGLKRGDIVVFKSQESVIGIEKGNEKLLIKRLIGLPGDKVEIKKGTVYVNGTELKEPYVKNNEEKNMTFDVPEGKYLFFGDNRAHSQDSRYWKNPYVDGSNIVAKAGLRIFPLNSIGFLK